MRIIGLVVLAAFLPLLAACGGGSGYTASSAPSAELNGLVYELNGQTADRSDVLVRVMETDAIAVTDVDGAFSFRSLPEGTLTLEFTGPGAAPSASDGILLLTNVTGGETLTVRVALQGSRLVSSQVDGDDEHEAEAALERDAASPDDDVEGEVELESEADGDGFEVEAENLDAGTVVDVFLDGTLIGSVAADADGEAELEFENSLPLGAVSAAELEGLAVEVRLAATGEVLLRGTVPFLN